MPSGEHLLFRQKSTNEAKISAIRMLETCRDLLTEDGVENEGMVQTSKRVVKLMNGWSGLSSVVMVHHSYWRQ